MTPDVYENPDARAAYRVRYFTSEGENVLEERLKTLVLLHAEGVVYPFRNRILGFPVLEIHSRSHHEGMIDELSQVLGVRKQDVQVVRS